MSFASRSVKLLGISNRGNVWYNRGAMEKRNSKKPNHRLLWRFLKGSKTLFAVSMLASVVSALCDMVSPQIVRIAVDNALGGAAPTALPAWVIAQAERLGGFRWLGEHIWVMAAALIAVALVKAAAQYGYRVSNTAAAERLVKTARDSLFSHIERLPYAWHMKHRTGDIIQRCTSDLDTLKNFISQQMTEILRVVILLALSITFMLGMNGRLTLIVLAPVPVIIGYSLVYYRIIGTAFLRCDENEGILSAMAQENLAGVRVVRAFGREKHEQTRFSRQNRFYTDLWMKLAKPMATFWSIGDILSGAQILLTVCFGAVFCVRGEMLAGEYIAFLSYCALMTWPVRMLGRMISEMSKAGVSIDRIAYIMDSEEERDAGAGAKPDLKGDIEFDGVTFAYDPEQELLRDIRFTVKGGSTLGILGGTGSGKSTLMLLLSKLYELPKDGGSIRIGGVDIRDIDTAWLRRNIAMVLQEPFLFSRSIEENIAISEENADTAQVRAAARVACMEETVDGFPAGFDTFVGERGVTLSGGQKQRVAIARALMRQAPIMVFDDSLSAVDTETDAKIRAGLSERFAGSTVFLISHRITTLKNADLILVLDHGQIAESGTHEELRRAGGLYQRICEIQEEA